LAGPLASVGRPLAASPANDPPPLVPEGPPRHQQQTHKAGDWRPLFNGKDLDGWEARPRPGSADGASVFRPVQSEGQPALIVSGTGSETLTSKVEFGNFHLRGEFRWHQPPPLGTAAGLVYHTAGLAGLEFRLGAGQCGGLALPRDAGLTFETDGQLRPLLPEGESVPPLQYAPGGRPFTVPLLVPPLVLPRTDAGRPAGQWNTLEILAVGDTVVHRVNGQLVLRAINVRRWHGLEADPVRQGRIQLKAAGGEITYRNLAILPITSLEAKP
jgi:hypothetical protein